MERLDELKTKYRSMLDLVPQKGVVLSHVHVQDNKLFVQGAAPTEDLKNDIWNEAKTIDSSYSDLTLDLTVDSSLPRPAPAVKKYTVKAGDSLWKIAAEQMGNGTLYPKIVAANPGKLKDEHTVIHPGDELIIP
jgi:nucleoid-associated protein YgaU